MKKTTISMIVIGLAVSAFAQDPASTPASTPAATSPANPAAQHERHMKGKRGGEEGPMKEALESLTPAEQTQFIAARKKAMEDPTVIEAKKNADAARKDAFAERKSALLKQDPSLASILDKVQTPRDLKNLTPEEHQKVQAARKAAKKETKGLPKAAPAEKAFHEALRAAMLKADPTIGPVLDKVDAAMKAKWSEMKDQHDKNNPEPL